MKPIIFNSEMVKAILDGRKTQTRRIPTITNSLIDGRRVSKKTWDSLCLDFDHAIIDPGPSPAGNLGPYLKVPSMIAGGGIRRIYPIYAPGDLLWVRETWQYNPFGGIVYRAGSGIVDCDGRGWKPSIHMKKEDSRLTLKIKDIRVERVNEISEGDAKAEGAKKDRVIGLGAIGQKSYREGLYLLWNSINEKRGFGWDKNPFCWPIEFERVK